MPTKPTRAQTWGGVTIISGIAGTIASSFILWVVSGNLQLPKIIEILERQDIALTQIVKDNKDNARQDIISHRKIRDEVSALRGDIKLLNHEIIETDTDCDEHIKNGMHK